MFSELKQTYYYKHYEEKLEWKQYNQVFCGLFQYKWFILTLSQLPVTSVNGGDWLP